MASESNPQATPPNPTGSQTWPFPRAVGMQSQLLLMQSPHLVELQPHSPCVVLLGLVDRGLQGPALGAEPEAVVHQLSIPAGQICVYKPCNECLRTEGATRPELVLCGRPTGEGHC